MGMGQSIPEWDSTQELIQDQGQGGTAAQDKLWAEQYARAHPEWTGNSVWKAENGVISPRASWLERNGWVFPVAVGAGVLAAPAIGGWVSGSGAATGASSAGAAGVGTTGAAGAGTAGAAGAAGFSTAGAGAAGVSAFTDILTSVFSSRSQQTASREAAQMQYRATQDALAYQREQDAYTRQRDEERTAYDRRTSEEARGYDRNQYANYLGRLDPYAKVGAAAVTGLASSLPSVQSQRPTMGGMVKIQAPTGEVRDVPEAHAAHYLSLGGKRVD